MEKRETPKVSVILISYNGRASLVKRAINSVLAQTYKNWELVVQDDCSTDGSFNLLEVLAQTDDRIKLYRNKYNIGIARNRLAAYTNCTGELICHLDNDDFLYPHALAYMAMAFVQQPEIGFAYSDQAFIDEKGQPFQYVANTNFGEPLTQYGWRHLGMYRRSAYEATEGYNTELDWPCEDGDLFMQIAEKFPFKRVPHVLYGYNNSGDHASHQVPQCQHCLSRARCNFIRVWADACDPPIDVITWKAVA
jgi:glycosyltransferase involved in cell wall biosynthesis